MVSKSRINEKIALLAYNYVFHLSRKKKYNVQMMAIRKSFRAFSRRRAVDILKMPVEEFCKKYNSGVVKDFVYKNDSFTPRNMYLVSPLYYLYYTYIVFKISYLYSQTEVNFSKENIFTFYSGRLDFNNSRKSLMENVSFDKSYASFQQKRKEYFGKWVLSTDIQNFFDNIRIIELLKVLRGLFGTQDAINDLEYFLKHCYFDSLPQLHYSIASSVLSQFFLTKFDNEIQDTLKGHNLIMVRFVDDMYFVFTQKTITIKENNEILNELSSFLWKQGLALNKSKTKLLSVEEYVKGFDVVQSDYGDSYSSEKIIDEKATEVITNGDFLKFIEKLCDLEKTNGIDLGEYSTLLTKFLAIEGDDANKVLRNIIFSKKKKWASMNVTQLKSMVQQWRYILFNPSDFTVLYLMICRYLEKQKSISDSGRKIRTLLNYLFHAHTLTLRDSIVAVTYLFQSNLSHGDLIKKVHDVNPNYVKFIEDYIT